MGTHPIFESDFDCLTENLLKMFPEVQMGGSIQVDAMTMGPQMGPKQRTLSPAVTGGAILAVKYDTGVMVAGDTLGAYGGLHRFRDIRRVVKLNENVIVTYTGDTADFQHLQEMLEGMQRENDMIDDGTTLGPVETYNVLERIMYNRRSRNNPYWNTLVISGYDVTKDEPFLGQIDSQGTSFQAKLIGTGFGGFLVGPLMERQLESIRGFGDGLPNRAQAEEIMERSLKVLYYRDKSTYNNWSIGFAEKNNSMVNEPKKLETNWRIADQIHGYE